MATRIYLPSSGAIPMANNPSTGTWTETTGFDRVGASTSRTNTAMTNKTQARTANAANNTWLDRQYIIGPLAAQTYGASTIKGTIRALESAVNDNVDAMRLLVRVVAPDGTTFRGTIYGPTNGTVAEFNTSLRAKRLATGGATTSVTITEGDFLVIEIGATATTGGTSISTSINYGDNSATDLGDNETDTAANNPFVELAANIKFLQDAQGQAQASIKQTYRDKTGQAQADIENTYIGTGQAQADIKQTYFGLGQAQALIPSAATNVFGQAQVSITREIANYTDAASNTSHTITLSKAPVIGNHLILDFIASGNITITSITDTGGNTWQVDKRENSGSTLTLVKASTVVRNALAVNDTIVIVISGSQALGATVREVYGLSQYDWLEATSSANSAGVGVTTFDTGNLTTNGPNRFLSASLGVSATSGTITYNETGWTPRPTAASTTFARTVYPHDKGAITATTYKFSGSHVSTRQNAEIIVAYKPAGTVVQPYAQAQADIKAVNQGLGQAQAQVILKQRGLGQSIALITTSPVYTSVSDTFTRSVTDGLGTADTGGDWTYIQGTVANADVTGSVATFQVDSTTAYVSNLENTLIGGPGQSLSFRFKFDTLPDFSHLYYISVYQNLGTNETISSKIGTKFAFNSATNQGHLDMKIGASTTVTGTSRAVIAGTWYIAESYYVPSSENKMRVRLRFYEEGTIPPAYNSIATGSLDLVVPGHIGLEIPPKSSGNLPIVSIDDLNIANVSGWTEFGQAQATIAGVAVNRGLAQAQADIKQTYFGLAQAQSDIKNTYRGMGQAQADIKQTYPLTSIYRVQPAVSGITTNGTSVVLNINATSGNLLYVVAAANINDFLSISDGVNTWQSLDSGVTWDGDAWYAKNITGGNLTITISGTATSAYAAQVIEFGGVDKVNPIVTKHSSAGTGGANFDSGTTPIAATSIDDYVIGSHVYVNNTASASVISNDSFTPALAFQHEEGYQDAVGTSTAAGFLTSHGKINGLTTEKATATSSGSTVLLWSWVTILAPSSIGAFGQAQARIKNTYFGLAQAQARIKQTYFGLAQANADIKQTYYGLAQAQADLKNIYFGLAQAQTDIKAVGNGLAQAQARIKNTYFGLGQAQADVKNKYFGLGQAKADIKNTYPKVAQAQAFIRFYGGFGQALADIDTGIYTLVDTFTRTVSNAWGTPDVGPGWDITYTDDPTRFAVNGSTGTIVASGNTQTIDLFRLSVRNVRIAFDFKLSSTDAHILTFNIRSSATVINDNSNSWNLTLYIDSAGLVTFSRSPVIPAPPAPTSTEVTTVTTGVDYRAIIEFIDGANSTAYITKVRIYPVGSSETEYVGPSASDSVSGIPALHTIGGVRFTVAADNITTITFDNFNITQTINASWGQAQAKIQKVGFGLGQANAAIKAVGNGLAQAQAAIKQTYYGLGQTQGAIKNTYSQVAQAQASIKTTYFGLGQSQARILNTYFGLAQSQTDIKQTYTDKSGQAQATIQININTYSVVAQAQADIKHTYSGSGQAQADIKQTYPVCYPNAFQEDTFQNGSFQYGCEGGFGQAQATIKTTYFGLAQANAAIARTYTDKTGQANADIKATSYALGQSQSDIKQTYVAVSQSQADIKNTYYGTGQSQVRIKQTYFGLAQSQADIKASGFGLGQANADIKAQGFGLGQAQSDIKQMYFGLAQSQADIRNTYFGLAQAQARIQTTYFGLAQAQACIRGNAFGQAQADIKATYFGLGQAASWLKNTYFALGQAQVWIEQTYSQVAQAQADIKTTYTQNGQANADIKQVYTVTGQAAGWIKNTYYGTGQSQANIKNTYYVSAQAQAKINAYGVTQSGQAQANLRFNGNAVSGQAQAKINAFGYPQWGQAQADIKATSFGLGQSQADIKQVYSQVAQAQARILNTYYGLGQSNADIKAQGYGLGQANAYIILSGRTGLAQAQADIRATYFGLGQAQALIKRTENAVAQANADIKNTYTQTAQAQADIKNTYTVVAQAQTDIRATYFGLGQANANIKAFGVTQSGQAQANISFSGNAVFGQAQAKIKAIGVTASGQAQSDIKQSYTQSAQSNADIKHTYTVTGQANAAIANTYFASGQAQAYIKGIVQVSGQAQGDIKQSYTITGQSQADIKSTYYGLGQANAYILTLKLVYGQTQADIRSTYRGFAQAQADILHSYTQSGNAQSAIRITVNAYAQAQGTIKATVTQSGQASAAIISGLAGYGQAQADILATYAGYAQTQAFISKSAGYGQAQALIRVVFFFGSLAITDDLAISLTLSDDALSDIVQEDAGKIELTLSDSNIDLILSDSNIDLLLSDSTYEG